MHTEYGSVSFFVVYRFPVDKVGDKVSGQNLIVTSAVVRLILLLP